MMNQDFRREFINTYADHLNSTFKENRAGDRLAVHQGVSDFKMDGCRRKGARFEKTVMNPNSGTLAALPAFSWLTGSNWAAYLRIA